MGRKLVPRSLGRAPDPDVISSPEIFSILVVKVVLKLCGVCQMSGMLLS